MVSEIRIQNGKEILPQIREHTNTPSISHVVSILNRTDLRRPIHLLKQILNYCIFFLRIRSPLAEMVIFSTLPVSGL